MNRLLEVAFERRGMDAEALMAIERVRVAELADIGRLLGILKDAHDARERVVIFPDFDCDGVMSAVIGFAGLAELGFDVGLYVPDPKRGYGLDAGDFERALADNPTMRVVLTCDVGIDCHSFCAAAKAAGMTVLVTDHHVEPSARGRVAADCVVDPRRADETYPFPDICGAFVLWKCLMAYAEAFGTKREAEQIRRLRVFAGIGTVSDAMPLLSENRGVVRDAVGICRLVWGGGDDFFCSAIEGTEPYVRAFRGLREVLDGFASAGKISEDRPLEESFFGFYLSPAVNALKRVQRPVVDAYLAFLDADARPHVRALISANEERKELVACAWERMVARDQPRAPWLWESDAPGSILGLLANMVLKETGRPALVCQRGADGHSLSGSGRSPDYYPALSQLSSIGVWARGHECAFGVRLSDDDEADAVCNWLRLTSERARAEAMAAGEGTLPYDYLVSAMADERADADIDIPLFFEFAEELERMRPFGRAFPEPVGWIEFPTDGVELRPLSGGRHLKASLARGMDVLVWDVADELDVLMGARALRVEGGLRISHFGGETSVNFEGRRAWPIG